MMLIRVQMKTLKGKTGAEDICEVVLNCLKATEIYTACMVWLLMGDRVWPEDRLYCDFTSEVTEKKAADVLLLFLLFLRNAHVLTFVIHIVNKIMEKGQTCDSPA